MASKRKYKVMKEFRLDEISAVDRPAQQPAVSTIMKRAMIAKGYYVQEQERRAMLSTIDGHQHTINIDVDHGETSFEDGHAHAWIRTLDGVIVIGAANGHVHEFNEDAISKQDEEGAPGTTDSSNNSPGNTADSVGNVHKEDKMSSKNDQTVDDTAVEKQLMELTKRAERAEAVSELSDAQRGIFKNLDDTAAQAFLAMSSEQRDAEVAKAAEANAVVYTDSRGVDYRKNDDQRLVELAKQMDEEKKERLKMEEKNKDSELEKRAAEFAHIPGNVKALLKGIDTIPDQAERTAALDALKAQDLQLSAAFKRAGTTGTPNTTESPLEAIAKRIANEDSSLSPEQAMAKALQTPEGELAYAKSVGLTN